MNNYVLYFMRSLLLILVMYSSPALTQNTSIDSLKNVLASQKEDTNKVNTLLLLSGRLYNEGNQKQTLQYLKEALNISEKLNFKKGMKRGYWIMLNVYSGQNDYIKELDYCYKVLQLCRETKDSLLMAATEQEIGNTNIILGDTSEALNSFFSALNINIGISNKSGISQNYNSIGGIYCKQGRYEEALEKHFAALEICEDDKFMGYGWEKPYSYQSIGNVYEKQGDEAKGKSRSMEYRTKYLKALEKYKACYKIWEKLQRKDLPALAELDWAIGNVNIKLNNFKSADEKLHRSLKAYLQIDDKEYLNEVYLSLSLLDSAKGNYKSAYENYKLHTFYKKINNEQDIIRKAEGFKMKSQFEKKETELKLLSTENKLQIILAKEQSEKKNIAYAFIVFILLAGGYGFYRFRERRRIKSIEDLNKERLRISQELHDEVGATLSGISLYSHLAKAQIKRAQIGDVEKSLNIMQQSAGHMVNKLNDIVWLINPDQHTLQQLMQRLEEYAADMASVKNMQLKFTIPAEFAKQPLSIESRRNIYLFCKEAINNAVKYSEASLLELYVNDNNHLLEIIIRDNGKGCNMDEIKRGNGLNNMQKRADELKADFIIRSKPGEGCLISLKVKFTQ